MRRPAHRTLAPALAGALLAATMTSASAAASTDGSTDGSTDNDAPPALLTLDDLGGEPDQDSIDAAVTTRNVEPGVNEETYDLEGRIERAETVETKGDDVTVTLATDVLFDYASADLSRAAESKIADLVADADDGSSVEIDGHTDSTGPTKVNQKLSERRAQAVADVVADARPDLEVVVHGYGESRPEVSEGGDDVAKDRAQNRRVEIRYTGTAPGETSTENETTDVQPVDSPYSPGDEPRVEELDPEDVVVEETMRVPVEEGTGEDGARIRVGGEELVVRGPVVRLRLQLTPLDPVPGWTGPEINTENIDTYDMTNGELHELLVDTESLTSYLPVSTIGQQLGASDKVVYSSTEVGMPLRYEAYFPRPVDEDLTTLDVSVAPTWPLLEDVPIRWDG